MPTPVSGDKIFTQYDTKPTRRDENRAEQTSTASASGKAPSTKDTDDSVELHSSLIDSASPPNTSIGSPSQARQVLGELLAAIQRDPTQASAAHAQASQLQTDAALASPVT